MTSCLQFFCCCFYPQNTPHNHEDIRSSRGEKKKKTQIEPKKSRLITKYKKQQIDMLTKQQKRNGGVAYTCPICTNIYSKILACQLCQNTVCRQCLQAYEKKYLTSKDNMKCPFCGSDKSLFLDYQKQAHSYFDTTNKNGFLDASERKKIDQQLQKQQNKLPERLSIINEQQPTQRPDLQTNNQIYSPSRVQNQRQRLQTNPNENSNIVMIIRNQLQINQFDQIEAISN